MTVSNATTEALSVLINTAVDHLDSFIKTVSDTEGLSLLRQVREALGNHAATLEPTTYQPPGRLPGCSWLEPALKEARGKGCSVSLVTAFERLEPALVWTQSEHYRPQSQPPYHA